MSTKIRQKNQIDNSESYNDSFASLTYGSTLESSASTLEDDLNALRTQIKRILGTTDWYSTPPQTLQAFASANAFLGLSDTPSSFSGKGGYYVAVNSGESALEFVEKQYLWKTIAADSGTTTADVVDDTLNIVGGSGAATSISGDTVTISLSATTDDVSEGSNLYYTNARVASYLSGNTITIADLYVTGNIGLGIASPSAKLHLYASTAYSMFMLTGAYTPTGSTDKATILSFGDLGTSTRAQIGLYDHTSYLGGAGTNLCITSSGSIAFGTGSASVAQSADFFIDSTGKVGINTDNPTVPLHVMLSGTEATGNTGSVLMLQNSSTAASDCVLNIIAGNAGKSYVMLGDTDNVASGRMVYNHSDNTIYFGTEALDTSRLTISTAGVIAPGKLSVGTTSSNVPLEVESGSNANDDGFRVTRNGTATQYIGLGSYDANLIEGTGASKNLILQNSSTTAGDIVFKTAGANTRMTITYGGDVVVASGSKLGVGGSPTATLDVTGTGAFSSGLTVGGDSLIEGRDTYDKNTQAISSTTDEINPTKSVVKLTIVSSIVIGGTSGEVIDTTNALDGQKLTVYMGGSANGATLTLTARTPSKTWSKMVSKDGNDIVLRFDTLTNSRNDSAQFIYDSTLGLWVQI